MDAIAIEVEGEFIDLQDASLRLEIVNSLFSTEIYQGDYSFPFNIAPTAKNLRLFGYPNNSDAATPKLEYAAQVYVYGVPKFKTKLKITRCTSKSIAMVLSGGIKALANADKKLTELNWPADFLLGRTQAEVIAKAKLIAEEGDWTIYGFSFVPFFAPNFYNGKNSNFLSICNRVNSTNGNLLANSTSSVNNKYNLVPWLFLFYVLNQIFKENNLTPSGSFWQNPEFSKLLLFNNRALDLRPESFNTVVRQPDFSVRNYNATGQALDMDLGPPGTYDNPLAWDDVNNEYIVQVAGFHKFQTTMLVKLNTTAGVPPAYLRGGSFELYFDGVLQFERSMPDQSIFQLETVDRGIGFERNMTAGDIGKAIQIRYKKSTSTFQTQTFLEVRAATMKVTIDAATLASVPSNYLSYKNHVTEWTAGELLAEVKKLGVNFNFDKPGEVIMDTATELLSTAKVLDLSKNAEPELENNFEETQRGYKIAYEFESDTETNLKLDPALYLGEIATSTDLPASNTEGQWVVVSNTNEIFKVIKNGANLNEWKLAGYNYSPFTVGNAGNLISSKLTPMLMTLADNEGGTADQNLALMPFYKGIGSSNLFDLGINPFTFSLAFWRGYNQPGGAIAPKGGRYILATPLNLGINNNKVGDVTMRLDSENNMIRANTERLLIAINDNPIVEKNIQLDPIALENLSGTSKVIVHYSMHLVKSISISIDKKMAQAKAYLLKI